MSRPTTIKDDEILRAARECFWSMESRRPRRGCQAGQDSEGTIFHRFKSKVELFRAAMDLGGDNSLMEWPAGAGDAGRQGENLGPSCTSWRIAVAGVFPAA